MTTSKSTMTKRTAMPSKIAPNKVYDYIKKIEVDGYPRVRAYAEAIDPLIYELTPTQAADKLDYLVAHYPGFKDIKESVLAEQQDWSLRRSAAIQNKAIDLLSNLLDKANQIATDPNTDARDLNVAVSTLKAIMPAYTAVGNKQTIEPQTDRKARAGRYIN